MPSTMSFSNHDTVWVESTSYHLFWRMRPSHPWHSQQFDSRSGAYQRYFALVERGIEAYLERRKPERSS